MNLEVAILERDRRLDRYMEAQKRVDRMVKEAMEVKEIEAMSRKVKKTEVARLCGITPNAVYKWQTDCTTFAEWCRYLAKNHPKYLKRFKNNYKKMMEEV